MDLSEGLLRYLQTAMTEVREEDFNVLSSQRNPGIRGTIVNGEFIREAFYRVTIEATAMGWMALGRTLDAYERSRESCIRPF